MKDRGTRGGSGSHPPGLYVLFFTEMWERYSFYSMLAILVLYMDEALLFSQSEIGQVYGGYNAAVWFLPLLGGVMADRLRGCRRAVFVGGILMVGGHLLLALESPSTFYAALALLACGVGLFKPNVSTLVGNLYRDRPALRDAGFNIFYMGVSLGGIVAPFVVAYLRATRGRGAAFGSAAVAMFFSLVIFAAFRRHVVDSGAGARRDERGPDLSPAEARARLVALLVVFVIMIPVWIPTFQIGFTLVLWTRDNVQTSLPPEVFQSLNPLSIVAGTRLIIALWSRLRLRGAEPSGYGKMILGILIITAGVAVLVLAGLSGGDTGRVSVVWLVAAMVSMSASELFTTPPGLAMVTRVAPPELRGTLMGGWFVTLAIAAYISGWLGSFWDRIPHSQYFMLIGALTALSALALAVAGKRFRAVLLAGASAANDSPAGI